MDARIDTHPLRSPMPDWRRHFILAANEHEIVRLTREHLATWGPEDISCLPESCRPRRVADGDDIAQWAYELARAHCSLRYDGMQDALILRLMAFMSEAAMRLAEVKAVEAAAARGA